jgi:hypothetical protein
MRYIVFTIATLMSVFLMSPIASGQAENPQLDAARAELQAGRDQIIREDLQLSEEELAAFWPVYEQYLSDLSPIRGRKGSLVKQFMQAYRGGEFSDEFAEWLIEENFAIKEAWTEVQRAYVDRFRAVLPPQAVARFYQLENKLDAEVDAQLALIVPLVE